MYNAFCHWFSALEVSVCRLCKLTRYGRHELCRRLFNQFVPALTYKCVIVYVYIYVCKLLLNCVSKLCICLLYVNCYSFRRGRRELGGRSWLWPRAANCPLCTVDFAVREKPKYDSFHWNHDTPESIISRSLSSSVQIQIKPISQFEFAPWNTEKSELLDLVDFVGVAFSVETGIRI